MVAQGRADAKAVNRIARNLRHRGPDQTGRYRGDRVCLAVTRLSIIDPALSGQPFVSPDGSLVLVANAEIYNYRELRRELRARGRRLRSNGDCEVILHLYDEYGIDAIRRLRGMFAFALWDGRLRRLILARDRMGENPLYLREGPGALHFSSELTALLAARDTTPALDPHNVDLFFHYQYVPEPRTIVQGIRKLPAGHLLIVDIEPWRIRQRRYWDPADAPRLNIAPGKAIASVLEELAPLVVRSDRPVGVALSSGLDSSLVAALAARHAPGPVHAFTVGYGGAPHLDERAQARRFAAECGLEFHDIELDERQVVSAFPDLVRAWDDPVADMTGFCYRAVMRAADSVDVRVMLAGQGADELFWGYPWVRAAMRRSADRHQVWEKQGATVGRLVFYDLNPDFREAQRRTPSCYGEAMTGLGAPTSLFTLPLPRERLAVDLTVLIMNTYLAANGIGQGDRLGMASSVELRLPLVDHSLVETVLGLRTFWSDHEEPPKQWLRDAAADLLPAHVRRRAKKPFSPPLSRWHRALLHAYGHLLPNGTLVRRGILNPAAAHALAHEELPRGAGSPLSFKALVLETWCRLRSGEPVAAAGPGNR